MLQQVTGVQRYAREFIATLDMLLEDRRDLTVRLLTPPISPRNVPPLRHIRHEAVGRSKGHLWEQLELPKHVGDATLFCPGNTAPVASLLGPRRVVVTLHDLSYRYFPNAYSWRFKLLYNWLIPLVLRNADQVITVSQSERSAILACYPFAADRLVAIQNGGLPTMIDQQEPSPQRKPTVLYVGSLSKRKNFPAMLAVAAELARTRKTHFVFIGSVPPGLTESLAQIPDDLKDHIQFVGQVNDWDRLLTAYRSATCFMFPSLYEASPLPPIEAMGCGCPVLASDIPSLEERCGDAALYCDPNDTAAITASLATLLEDTDLQSRLRSKGYQRASLYSWRRCVEDTLAVILAGVQK
ncbi:MAG: glycosyltransferase family 1 protein [Cytophagaceae bacterium]|nr:MAG: glycosyltransferase family 1 protein [Cytophagaceae bacterium]